MTEEKMTPEEQELAELRARRAAVADRRLKRAELEAAKDRLEAERRALVDEEAIARFEEEYGPIDKAIATVQTDLGVVILKRAKPPAYKRFNDLIARENPKQFELSEQLVSQCLLHPSSEAFAAMIEKQPFTLIRCANAIAALAGVRTKEINEK